MTILVFLCNNENVSPLQISVFLLGQAFCFRVFLLVQAVPIHGQRMISGMFLYPFLCVNKLNFCVTHVKF